MNRRRLLKATAGFAVIGLAMPRMALAAATERAIRGSINARDFGVFPDAAENQSSAFGKMLERAGADDLPVFLPPGRYVLANVTLPPRVRLSGVPGATRLIQGGGALLIGQTLSLLALSGLTLDGAYTPLSGGAKALLDIRGAEKIAIDGCAILNSGASGIALEQVGGRIERTDIANAAEYGIYSVDAHGFDFSDNRVADCGNGGILVHRRQPGEDGTGVFRNRIARIRADRGGTGQYGNAINAYRADNVRVGGNHISDSAFSAIRGNSAGNMLVDANTCLRSGETAVYAEFAFQGAVISANIVDGAAHGISMANFDKGGRLCTCSGNIVRNLSPNGPYPSPLAGFGVGINVEADSAVTGNVIENAPLCGIRIGWGPFLRNVTATGNVIRKAATGIAVSVVEGSGSAVISGNVISESPRGAIVGHRWAEAVTKDLAMTGSAGHARLTVENNQVS
ncbi:TIGR03808 family TAT-translocated repetitive protein [Nitratireductor soli]|uniref:TIGR03808 family TAT-translocated repetitive protein n=1 Tax=Nitratireductor soli TaxID=1670619 RepID=UPI00065DDE6A|nr:TIGR03808 family TAT-translocated repetitive protein [Nitratireductor soli]